MKHILNSTGHELKIPNCIKAKGIFIYDDEGKKYMDLQSGTWSISIGHNNEIVSQAIKNQIDLIMHAGFCYSNDLVENSAQVVLKAAGFDNGKCVFNCSGSEAIEICRQIARSVTGLSKSMTLHDSYLGAYSSVVDRSTGWFSFDWDNCKECSKGKECDKNCPELKKVPDDIADFVFEPGSAGGFVRFPPAGLIRNLVSIVNRNGGKVIANEVTTGTGRTGKLFGYQHFNIKPDMIATGKGIGNGYPVSVALINEKTVIELKKGSFKYAQSHMNDPLGAVVVKQVLEYIESYKILRRVETLGKYLGEKLKDIVDGKIISASRGKGFMHVIEIGDKTLLETIYDTLIDRGFILGNRGTALRIDPPLITEKNDIDLFLNNLEKTVHELS